MRDGRLTGCTAEHIFLSLLNEKGCFATSFDTIAFDGIVFDTAHAFFLVGDAPFYVQVKCRGSNHGSFNPQGHPISVVEGMKSRARELEIPETSLYFAVGFFKDRNMRTVVYYCAPLGHLERFRTGTQYRFSVDNCEAAVAEEEVIFRL